MVTILTVYLTVVFCLSAIIREVPAQSENDNGICSRMYIRNGPQELSRLENCRVIEGSLQIALANGSTDQWKNFSFPLREITGYLLLYDARGLQSLRHIFPNLTVIRGQEFIHNNYALLVNDMPDMQEIGLPSLTNILNGKVWIYNNQNLCYLETIDWGKITNGTQGNGIKKNKPSEQCPNTCPLKSCPKSDQGLSLCWSNEDCQKVQVKTCPEDCDGQNCEDCCSDQCLGGCTGPGPRDCFVCKHVEYNGLCMSNCPAGTYMYLKTHYQQFFLLFHKH
ncbi:unnamed protein product [Allacma fusca]|uniref:Receptor protein-tyrosine kinase n=1 Tax=Allacma fusca TaxID=39272 RepID=A0A8J2PXL8_9HEXA|nr:unnamed protein product [Allacma fusca]